MLATWENNGGHGVLLDAGQATLEIFDERLLAPDPADALYAGRRLLGGSVA
jgi:hypothetical protein